MMCKKKLKAVKKRKKSGCIYVNPTHGNTNKRFYRVLLDNTDKFLTKVYNYWIFDASAYNECEYNYAQNKLNFSWMEIDDKKQENIHVTWINKNTSKTKLLNNQDGYRDTLLDKLLDKKEEKPAVITYKDITAQIEKRYNCDTMYFGNTRGSNDFRDKTHLMQIGLNRQDDLYYASLYLSLHQEEQSKLNKMAESEIVEYFGNLKALSHGMFLHKGMQELMESKIAADFEQNIFRSKLRNFNNTDRVTLSIVCSNHYFMMLEKVLKQYNINWVEDNTLVEDKIYSGSKAEKLQKYLDKIESGTEFTAKDMYAVLELGDDSTRNSKELNRIKQSHPTIKQKLDDWQLSKGKYRRP